jgi:predicted DNA-binding transcriptional regulator AlpA
MQEFEEIRRELREIKDLLTAPTPREDDLVDARYVAERAGLAERTVLEGKAGTDAIPRVALGRKIVRFRRGAVDKWIRELGLQAAANQPRTRALALINRKAKTTRRRAA